jgi:hypothetical protein
MPCSATTRLPGVASGQFLHYSLNQTVSGNDTELISHIQQVQGWINLTVLSISGVNITCQYDLFNGTTTQSNTEIFNVETGYQANGSYTAYRYLIAANLSAGDPIYVGWGDPFYINETMLAVDYLDLQLETDHAKRSFNETNWADYVSGYIVNITVTMQGYWERRTGMMLDYHIEYNSSRSDDADGVLATHLVRRWLILSALPSPPVIPEFPSFLFLPLFIIATLLSVIIYKRKRVESK